MRILTYILILTASLGISCEELVHIDLNTGDPRYVIEADLHNLSNQQRIHVSQTVPFDSDMASKPVKDAQVEVLGPNGRRFVFNSAGDGWYNASFIPVKEQAYTLSVRVGDQVFSSTETLHEFIDVDSVGSMVETIFNEDVYSVIVKFLDPKGQENYYKYQISVNGGPFKFIQAFNDKYNDGLNVTHQLRDFNTSFKFGDNVVVRRQIISKPVFTYWNQIQMLNPGSAAPANPKSNISNGAFGYFSLSSTKEYHVAINATEKEN